MRSLPQKQVPLSALLAGEAGDGNGTSTDYSQEMKKIKFALEHFQASQFDETVCLFENSSFDMQFRWDLLLLLSVKATLQDTIDQMYLQQASQEGISRTGCFAGCLLSC